MTPNFARTLLKSPAIRNKVCQLQLITYSGSHVLLHVIYIVGHVAIVNDTKTMNMELGQVNTLYFLLLGS